MWRRHFLFSLSLFRVQFPPWMSSRFLWINMNSSPPNIVLTPENGVRTGRPHRLRPFRKPGRKKAEPPGSGSAFLVIFSCLLGSPLCIQRQRPRPAAAGTQMTISPSASILQCPMQSRYPECLSLPPSSPGDRKKRIRECGTHAGLPSTVALKGFIRSPSRRKVPWPSSFARGSCG